MSRPNILDDETRRKALLRQGCTDYCIPGNGQYVGEVARCQHEVIRMCTRTEFHRSWWRILHPWFDRSLYRRAKTSLDEAATN